MSTEYNLECVAPSKTGTLIIIDSINPLPGSDTWRTTDPEDWGIEGGSVANWGTPEIMLYGAGAAPVVILQNLTKGTKPGDTGRGEKLYPDGTFPEGEFEWRCTMRD